MNEKLIKTLITPNNINIMEKMVKIQYIYNNRNKLFNI